MNVVLITGTRKANPLTMQHRDLVYQRLNHVLPFAEDASEFVLLTGGADGVDSMAYLYADQRGILCLAGKASWKAYLKAAGYKRNQRLVDVAVLFRAGGANVTCEAFPGIVSPGTRDCIKRAMKAKIPVHITDIPI